jgi:hypothetical protein
MVQSRGPHHSIPPWFVKTAEARKLGSPQKPAAVAYNGGGASETRRSLLICSRLLTAAPCYRLPLLQNDIVADRVAEYGARENIGSEMRLQ